MRIIHFSDTHIGSERYFEEKRLLDVIEVINDGDFDVAIHTGDVTDEGQRREYERAKAFMDAITKPLIALPGNHDARSGGQALFEEYIGPSDGFRLVGDALVVYATSVIADSNAGRIGRVRFDLLREAFYEHSAAPVKIFCTHHHILPVPSSGRERNVLENAGDLLDLVVKSDVDLVLLGHRHYPNLHQVENSVVLNAGTASSSKTRYGDVQSYNVIEIDKSERRVATNRADGRRTEVTIPRRRRTVFTDFGNRVLRIAQMANSFISESRLFRPALLDTALSSIAELEPDLVIHTGGVVGEGTPQDYEKAVELLSGIEAPLLVTPSGRDMNYLGYELFARFFGDLDPSFETENVYLHGVASFQYDSAVGAVGKSGRERLLSDLAAHEQRFTGVFLHHNLVPVPRSRNKGLLEDAGDVLRELVDSNVDLILTGTSSHPHAARVGRSVLANAGSVSGIYQRSTYGNSFNLVDIYEGAIAVSEISSMWGSRRLLGLWERSAP